MKSAKLHRTKADLLISELIRRTLLEYYIVREAEGEESGNPFTAAAKDSGGEEDAAPKDDAADAAGSDKEEDTKSDKKATGESELAFNFDISAVKKYNSTPFRNSRAVAKKITKNGILATVQPDGVDILVGFDDISESAKRFFKNKRQLKEEQNQREIDAMSAAMGDAFKSLGAEIEANKEDLQKAVADADMKVNESLGVLGVVGIMLAVPKIIEIITKGIGKMVSAFKNFVGKGEAKENEEEFAHTIIEFTHKWHKLYVKGIWWLLKVSGAYKKANITNEKSQMKAAEMLYYVIIAALAVYSGITAVSGFKAAIAGTGHTGFSVPTLEAAMALIKGGEVSSFVQKLGLA